MLALDVVQCMGWDKCIMVCVHHLGFIQSISAVLKEMFLKSPFKIKMLVIFEVIIFIFIKMNLLIMTSVCVRMG